MAVATCYLKEKMRFLDKWIHAFFSVLPFFTNGGAEIEWSRARSKRWTHVGHPTIASLFRPTE
ncbi:MAG: hypothetical protein DMG54_25965 [Acidobacteria bacterium]|nr:MAG: hypothetical protein DMG54_25965 [Acidobacteriota bacterium]